jgi:ribulose-phosphate 3-epimerase
MVSIAPSILSADFSRLGELVKECERAGANRIHLDVMDGHFVPNLSMGAIVAQGLRPVTKLPLEVHLMVEEPLRFIDGFVKAGADTLIGHLEVLDDPLPWIQTVRNQGKKVGLAINPATPVDAIVSYLRDIDLCLCMTVVPGFGGQKFIADSLPRIRQLRELLAIHSPACELEVDGGVDLQTGLQCIEAGANVLVAGTAIFGTHSTPTQSIREMLQAVSI